MKKLRRLWFARLAVSFIANALFLQPAVLTAGTPASPQSTARPFNLPVVGQVMRARSDARSTAFFNSYVPTLRQIINANLRESVALQNSSSVKLDANRLFLRQQATNSIRVYFLAEGAGYMNTLGFAFTPAGSNSPGTPFLVFPNASSGTRRSQSTPVMEGDFVEIGHGGNGVQLDFFLISDGANGGRTWLWNDVEKNVDDLQHVVAYHVPGSSLILIGFEDIVGGGDLDYNDCLFVVDIGFENIDAEYPH